MKLSSSSNNVLAALVASGELPETAMGSLQSSVVWVQLNAEEVSVAHLRKCSLCSQWWLGVLLSAISTTPSCVYTRGTPTQSNLGLQKSAYGDARNTLTQLLLRRLRAQLGLARRVYIRACTYVRARALLSWHWASRAESRRADLAKVDTLTLVSIYHGRGQRRGCREALYMGDQIRKNMVCLSLHFYVRMLTEGSVTGTNIIKRQDLLGTSLKPFGQD